MGGQKPDDMIGIDPDLAVTFLLTFVEDQLDAEVKMDCVNVVHIFLSGISRATHEADELTCLHPVSHFQTLWEGMILL